MKSYNNNPDNWIPCPAVVNYINQDQRSTKEVKRASNNRIYSGKSDIVND
jgi:hypothetical protein